MKTRTWGRGGMRRCVRFAAYLLDNVFQQSCNFLFSKAQFYIPFFCAWNRHILKKCTCSSQTPDFQFSLWYLCFMYEYFFNFFIYWFIYSQSMGLNVQISFKLICWNKRKRYKIVKTALDHSLSWYCGWWGAPKFCACIKRLCWACWWHWNMRKSDVSS